MKKKLIIILILLVVVAIAIGFKDDLIRSYVTACREKLESYTTQLLESTERLEGNYGIFKTVCYPWEGMVEFYIGGSGLAPSSTYKGFYYSADNTHKVFGAADGDNIVMEINGDRATWTDGTDNHGTSVRIAQKWFWFEASF